MLYCRQPLNINTGCGCFYNVSDTKKLGCKNGAPRSSSYKGRAVVTSKSLTVGTRGQRRGTNLDQKTVNLPAYSGLVQAVVKPSPSDGLFCWSQR